MKRYIRAGRKSTKPYIIIRTFCPQQIEGHADTLDEAIKIAERVHKRAVKQGCRVNKCSVVVENGKGGYSDDLYTTEGDL